LRQFGGHDVTRGGGWSRKIVWVNATGRGLPTLVWALCILKAANYRHIVRKLDAELGFLNGDLCQSAGLDVRCHDRMVMRRITQNRWLAIKPGQMAYGRISSCENSGPGGKPV
jgi:hypothetical protein